jgi:cytochrome b561
MPKWQIAASHLTHLALYLLMMAIPVSGWLMSSAKGFTTVYFGIFPLPDLLEKNKEIADLLESTHALLNYVLLAFVVLHIAGALKHQFIDKDNLINRMLIKK